VQDFFQQAREIVGAQQARQDAWRPIGVRWSGMSENPYPEVEGVDAVQRRLQADAERYAKWAASPTGRFVEAANLIYKATGDERLLQCYSRGLDTDADLAAKLLSTMEGPAADQARAALRDWKDAQ
jgi:broad specificity phosphatase PhoE